MKIKNDMKVILAVEQGLNDGVLNFALDLALKDNFYTQKEGKAYFKANQIACNNEYLQVYKNKNHRFDLLEYAIKKGNIEPQGWKISRSINNYVPFIEEC